MIIHIFKEIMTKMTFLQLKINFNAIKKFRKYNVIIKIVNLLSKYFFLIETKADIKVLKPIIYFTIKLIYVRKFPQLIFLLNFD